LRGTGKTGRKENEKKKKGGKTTGGVKGCEPLLTTEQKKNLFQRKKARNGKGKTKNGVTKAEKKKKQPQRAGARKKPPIWPGKKVQLKGLPSGWLSKNRAPTYSGTGQEPAARSKTTTGGVCKKKGTCCGKKKGASKFPTIRP